jgi:hypothetical protein
MIGSAATVPSRPPYAICTVVFDSLAGSVRFSAVTMSDSQPLAMRRYELIRGNIAPEVGTNVKAAGVARD